MITRRRSANSPKRKPKTKRKRDYGAEYARRIHRGIAKGLSRSQARGHARAGERPKPAQRVVNPNRKEELAIKVMKGGLTLRDAAEGFGLSEQHLRRYLKGKRPVTTSSR